MKANGFSLLELIIVLAISALTLTLVIPAINRTFFGEEDVLRAFLMRSLNQSMKKGKVVEIAGDGSKIKNSEGETIDLPYRGQCYAYPSGELRYCWFEKRGERKYYTVFDL
ncbi:MAG: type II secretion system protein [Aquificaceae bacterium]|jgi:prepilin-type N-terminal cleavage/methylation domain-containing protein|uniref:pilus assembly FimT family protein n=1 Tax=Hydrogenobacter sp. Uz 6-8 TaxID=3384828 RepID=UPI000F17339B|nr:MAG: type II secretion system protein [Aquificota bacterium]